MENSLKIIYPTFKIQKWKPKIHVQDLEMYILISTQPIHFLGTSFMVSYIYEFSKSHVAPIIMEILPQ
jgi:hypothetical protein